MKRRVASYLKLNNRLYRIRRKFYDHDGLYVFKLSGAGLRTIKVNCALTDATIIINGVQTRSLSLEPGTEYSWSVSKPGYNTMSGSGILNQNLTITINSVTLNAPAETSTLLTSETHGEMITGTSGLLFDNSAPISYVYSVSKEGYTTLTRSGQASSDTTVDIGSFQINTDIPDTTIVINGAETNSVFFNKGTPFTYTYSMSKPGFSTFTAIGTALDTTNIQLNGLSVTCSENDAVIQINNQTTSGVFFVSGTTFEYSYSITLLGSPVYTQIGSTNVTDSIYVDYKAIAVTANDAVVTITSLGSTFTGVGSATTKLPVGIEYLWTVSRNGYTGTTGSGTALIDLTIPVYAVTGQNATFDINGSGTDAIYIVDGTTISYTATDTGVISYTGSKVISADTVITAGRLTAEISPVPDTVNINGTNGSVALLEEGVNFNYTINATKSGYKSFTSTGTVSTTTTVTGTMAIDYPSYSVSGTDSTSNVYTLFTTTISDVTAGNYAITLKAAGSDSTSSISPSGAASSKYAGSGRGGTATCTVYLYAGAVVKIQRIGANAPSRTADSRTYTGTCGHTGLALYIDNSLKLVAGGGGAGSVRTGSYTSSGNQNWYSFAGGGGGYGGGAGTWGGSGLNYDGSSGSSSSHTSGTPYGGHGGSGTSSASGGDLSAKGGNGYVASDFTQGSSGTHYRVDSLTCVGGTDWGASSKKGNNAGIVVSFAHSN